MAQRQRRKGFHLCERRDVPDSIVPKLQKSQLAELGERPYIANLVRGEVQVSEFPEISDWTNVAEFVVTEPQVRQIHQLGERPYIANLVRGEVQVSEFPEISDWTL